MAGANNRTPFLSGLSQALLSEILQHLLEYTRTGQDNVIDLRALPMTDDDLSDLDRRLGEGEVKANLNVSGKSEVWETSYAGVWRLRHYGNSDAVMVDEIVIASIPEILISHKQDIELAVPRLEKDIQRVLNNAENNQGVFASHTEQGDNNEPNV